MRPDSNTTVGLSLSDWRGLGKRIIAAAMVATLVDLEVRAFDAGECDEAQSSGEPSR